jgi:predicted RNA-binding protein Jag
MQIPEGKQTVTVEGGDLAKAVAAAASELSVHPSQVDHKLDLSHFRSALGTSVSRSTVKIIAWASDRDISEAPPKQARKPRPSADEGGERSERPERSERRSRSRDRDRDGDDRRSRGRGRDDERRERRGAADGETDASRFAAEWFETTLKHMGVEATVVATGDDERVHVAITADRAGRIVGKKGATLRAIRHLVGLAIAEQFDERIIDVDVGDDRPRGDRDGDREERRSSRRDRGDRSDRGDRGDRKRGRGRGRSRGQGELSEDDLRALAGTAAKRVQESGDPITIKYAANSYDRRIMHLTIAEYDGVESNSKEVEVDGRTVKYVQVTPAE